MLNVKYSGLGLALAMTIGAGPPLAAAGSLSITVSNPEVPALTYGATATQPFASTVPTTYIDKRLPHVVLLAPVSVKNVLYVGDSGNPYFNKLDITIINTSGSSLQLRQGSWLMFDFGPFVTTTDVRHIGFEIRSSGSDDEITSTDDWQAQSEGKGYQLTYRGNDMEWPTQGSLALQLNNIIVRNPLDGERDFRILTSVINSDWLPPTLITDEAPQVEKKALDIAINSAGREPQVLILPETVEKERLPFNIVNLHEDAIEADGNTRVNIWWQAGEESGAFAPLETLKTFQLTITNPYENQWHSPPGPNEEGVWVYRTEARTLLGPGVGSTGQIEHTFSDLVTNGRPGLAKLYIQFQGLRNFIGKTYAFPVQKVHVISDFFIREDVGIGTSGEFEYVVLSPTGTDSTRRRVDLGWTLADPRITRVTLDTKPIPLDKDYPVVLTEDTTHEYILDAYINSNHVGRRVLTARLYSLGSDLRSLNLRQIFNGNLRGVNLSQMLMYHMDLANIDFSGADLQGAILRGTDLGGAVLQDADLRQAKMYGAKLERASLKGTDLRGAELVEADLGGADLTGANREGADQMRVCGSPNPQRQLLPKPQTGAGWPTAFNTLNRNPQGGLEPFAQSPVANPAETLVVELNVKVEPRPGTQQPQVFYTMGVDHRANVARVLPSFGQLARRINYHAACEPQPTQTLLWDGVIGLADRYEGKCLKVVAYRTFWQSTGEVEEISLHVSRQGLELTNVSATLSGGGSGTVQYPITIGCDSGILIDLTHPY